MLSRRNVRIKVMQMLYSMSRDPKLDFDAALRRYRTSVHQSFELYLYSLQHFISIAEFSRHVLARKQAKLLPSEDDKRFTAKLYENELIQSLAKNEGLQRLFKTYKLDKPFDKDSIRLFYSNFSKTDAYQDYMKQADSTNEDHMDVILALYKDLISQESYEEFMEDSYPLWIDDKSLVIGAMKKTLKALPAEENFYEDYKPTDETIKDFGETLLQMACSQDNELLQLIEPTLKNWDAERVAVIDMIILKMALCELTAFPTIPTKVTINEFVEISKLYSTEKSKDFINGILDRLMKKLHKEGKINKEGRGLMEN